MATTVEADTLKAFIPDLVTAICDCVQSVSDQCLARGLISETTHRQVLESRGTSVEQARTLILSVQNSIKANGNCLEVFLDILDEKLPYRVKEKLLREIRKEIASMCKALVPSTSQTDVQVVLEDVSLQHMLQQNLLFGRYENSINKYAHACAQKILCEETLQSKVKESERLKTELEKLTENQSSEVDATKELDGTKDRLSVCEDEIAELKERIRHLEGTKEEEDMQARQGKNIIIVATRTFARMKEEQFAAAIKEKEEEYKRLLKEEKDELRRKMQEEMDAKIRVKDLEHKVALQEKELKIKELEQSKTRQETTAHPLPEDDQQKRTSGSTSRSRKLPRNAYDTPEFKDAYGELLPLASEWTAIGMLLEVPPNVLTKISTEHKDINTCLGEVVLHWHERSFPKPVRMDIIDAIEKINASQAKIRSSSYSHNST